jgi:hypothetical protein
MTKNKEKVLITIKEYPVKCPKAMKLLEDNDLELYMTENMTDMEIEAVLPKISVFNEYIRAIITYDR